MTRKYFGTDGIRGRVGQAPIIADFAVRLGRAAGRVFGQQLVAQKILIGKDPRSSGYMLKAALEAGFSAAGALLADLQRVPQVMINVPIRLGAKPLEAASVQAALSAVERQLAGRGRVVLRASGTEPLVRVTVEGEQRAEVQQLAEQLAEAVRRADG